jgi:DNA-nicking Smr family endonuclease
MNRRTAELQPPTETAPVAIPIDGLLDLHTFLPREVKALLPAYLAECRRLGVHQVRIIHGKGNGTLRRTVAAVLARLPEVRCFRLAGEDAGGWGATVVELAPDR